MIDLNDAVYFRERYGPFRSAISKGPYTTLFHLRGRKRGFVSHIKPVYYEHLSGEWRSLGEVTTHHGNGTIRLIPTWYEYMTPRYFAWLQTRQHSIGGTLSIDYFGLQPRHKEYAVAFGPLFPAAGANSPVDGAIERSNTGVDLTYAAAHDATAGTTAYVTNTDVAVNNGLNGITYVLWRGVHLFDTSVIGSGNTVTSATLSLHGSATGKNDADSDAVNIYAATPAADNNLVLNDYNKTNFGTTAFASDITIASWSTTLYNDFILNASGLAAINITGISHLGCRTINDVGNVTPIGNAYAFWQTADTAGTTNDPKLAGNYTVPSSTRNLTLLGVGT